MYPILLRTVIIYFVLIISIRMTGKRQIGQMQLSELITAFLISEVAASPLTDPDIPIVYGLIPLLLIAVLEIIIAFVTTKSIFFKKLFESPPTVIISRGKLNIHAMIKQRMTVDELMGALRLKDVADISALNYCFLEQNGQVSAFTKSDKLMLPIISDGSVNKHNLKILGKDSIWLQMKLAKDGRKTESVFLMCSDGNSTFYIEKGKNN